MMWQNPFVRYPNNIKALQKERKMTIDQAARAVGMSRGGYLKLQRGENRLTQTTIERIARAFGVTPAELVPGFAGERSMPTDEFEDSPELDLTDAEFADVGRACVEWMQVNVGAEAASRMTEVLLVEVRRRHGDVEPRYLDRLRSKFLVRTRK